MSRETMYIFKKYDDLIEKNVENQGSLPHRYSYIGLLFSSRFINERLVSACAESQSTSRVPNRTRFLAVQSVIRVKMQ
jgi:hypothetical protein